MPKRKPVEEDSDEAEEEVKTSRGAPRLVLESFADIAEAALKWGDIEVDNDEISLESTSWKCTKRATAEGGASEIHVRGEKSLAIGSSDLVPALGCCQTDF